MSDDREPRIEHVPEVTVEMENWRDVPLFPGDDNLVSWRTSRRDPVEPVPIGTYVAKVFRVVGYDQDVDGSLMARLEGVEANGDTTGWAPTHLGLYPHSSYVLNGADTLDRLAQEATTVPRPQSKSGDET